MDIPETPELNRFVALVLLATRKNMLPWESDPADPNILRVALGDDGYVVNVREVEDFDGNEQAPPDQVLSLHKGDDFLFSLDRRVLNGQSLSKWLGENAQTYHVMDEIWRRAYLKSKRVTDHLLAVTSVLTDIIDPPDEDVPF